MRQTFTVGILFPGEMGASLGRLLRLRGIHVVTTLEGRSERTARRCLADGLTVLDSLSDVVSVSDMIMSAVPPAAALAVADQVASESVAQGSGGVYVDVNSVSPVTMRNLGASLRHTKLLLVDASIHGLATRLSRDATMYLSGAAASEVAEIVGSPPRTVILGEDVGQASLFKMLLGGTSKGLVALLLELSNLALQEGVLDEFWAECRGWYPGVMEPFERLLPTYPQHIGRRIQEIEELELTVSTGGREPVMAAAAHGVFARAEKSPETLRTLAERIVRSTRNKNVSHP